VVILKGFNTESTTVFPNENPLKHKSKVSKISFCFLRYPNDNINVIIQAIPANAPNKRLMYSTQWIGLK
jgi:hypothetical protein